MIEVFAAVTGASISVAAMAFSGVARRGNEGRDAVIRLTVAVETVATKLEELHIDIKSDRKEMYSRLGVLEQRVAKLEAR
jgi:hypothetical protein